MSKDIIEAASEGDIDEVNRLIQENVNIDAKANQGGGTPRR